MNSNYRTVRLLLSSISYFYLLELLLTHSLRPGVPQGIEYLVWLALGAGLFLLAWLISDRSRTEIAAGLWLFALFSAWWLDAHREALAALGLKKTLLFLLPSAIFILAFLLWLGSVILHRLEHEKNSLLISTLMIFPLWLLSFDQNLFRRWFDAGGGIGPVIFFALAAASILGFGLLLSALSALRLFDWSRLWLALVLPVAIFALYGPVHAQILQKRAAARAHPGLPDLILVTVDTLRRDYVGAYNPSVSTPNFDRLARDAVVFDHAISASDWTIPALASCFTGKWPHEHRAGKLMLSLAEQEKNYSAIAKEVPTLAEQLRKQGYQTAAFVDSYWLKDSGFPRGFDYYFLFCPPELDADLIGLTLARVGFQIYTGRYRTRGADWLTGRALAWLAAPPGPEPRFLWIHYYDPHTPYLAHPEFPVSIKVKPGIVRITESPSPEYIRSGHYNLSAMDKEFIRARYLGEVRYTDEHFGRLLRELQAEGKYEDALIILTSDHGDELWEHGGFEHGHTFYQELIAVPLLVKLPKNRFAGERVSALASTAQIYSTFLAAAGLKPGELPDLAALRENPANGLESVLSEFPLYFDLQGAIVERDLKKALVAADGKRTFYDLNADPGETSPLPVLAPADPALLQPIPAPVGPLESPLLSPELRKKLEALGYLK